MEAHEAVHLVITALQLQGDEEMTARLSRKNREVMDRLNQVQEYKRGLLTSLRLAYARFPLATRAAKEFHSKVQTCADNENIASRYCVPLLTVPILLASPETGYTTTTALCMVTSHQLLVTIPINPLLGILSKAKRLLFSIHDKIETWAMDKIHHGVLHLGGSHNPDGIKIFVDDTVIISFVPEIGSKRFLTFVDMVRSVKEVIEVGEEEVEGVNGLKSNDVNADPFNPNDSFSLTHIL